MQSAIHRLSISLSSGQVYHRGGVLLPRLQPRPRCTQASDGDQAQPHTANWYGAYTLTNAAYVHTLSTVTVQAYVFIITAFDYAGMGAYIFINTAHELTFSSTQHTSIHLHQNSIGAYLFILSCADAATDCTARKYQQLHQSCNHAVQ